MLRWQLALSFAIVILEVSIVIQLICGVQVFWNWPFNFWSQRFPNLYLGNYSWWILMLGSSWWILSWGSSRRILLLESTRWILDPSCCRWIIFWISDIPRTLHILHIIRFLKLIRSLGLGLRIPMLIYSLRKQTALLFIIW